MLSLVNGIVYQDWYTLSFLKDISVVISQTWYVLLCLCGMRHVLYLSENKNENLTSLRLAIHFIKVSFNKHQWLVDRVKNKKVISFKLNCHLTQQRHCSYCSVPRDSAAKCPSLQRFLRSHHASRCLYKLHSSVCPWQLQMIF